MYVTSRISLNQFDLYSANLQDSFCVYTADSTDYAQIDFIQLGPNGKLYGCTWNGGFYFLHTVNKPNEKGDSCGFVWGGQPTLSISSVNLPNMINYKLGPLAGSGCDTLQTATPKSPKGDFNSQIRVQPNPANKYFYTEMPMQGNYVFELRNEAGQLIERKETRQVDIFNTENLPAGVYFLSVNNKGNRYSTQKIVVQH